MKIEELINNVLTNETPSSCSNEMITYSFSNKEYPNIRTIVIYRTKTKWTSPYFCAVLYITTKAPNYNRIITEHDRYSYIDQTKFKLPNIEGLYQQVLAKKEKSKQLERIREELKRREKIDNAITNFTKERKY